MKLNTVQAVRIENEIPWFFQVFQVSLKIPGFPKFVGTLWLVVLANNCALWFLQERTSLTGQCLLFLCGTKHWLSSDEAGQKKSKCPFRHSLFSFLKSKQLTYRWQWSHQRVLSQLVLHLWCQADPLGCQRLWPVFSWMIEWKKLRSKFWKERSHWKRKSTRMYLVCLGGCITMQFWFSCTAFVLVHVCLHCLLFWHGSGFSAVDEPGNLDKTARKKWKPWKKNASALKGTQCFTKSHNVSKHVRIFVGSRRWRISKQWQGRHGLLANHPALSVLNPIQLLASSALKPTCFSQSGVLNLMRWCTQKSPFPDSISTQQSFSVVQNENHPSVFWPFSWRLFRRATSATWGGSSGITAVSAGRAVPSTPSRGLLGASVV